MNKLKHTPGPWKDTISKSGDSYSIYSEAENCQIVSMKRDPVVLNETWNRQLSDARLIAAAPEMLEALINYMKSINDENNTTGFGLFLITDIIEKATGLKIGDIIK